MHIQEDDLIKHESGRLPAVDSKVDDGPTDFLDTIPTSPDDAAAPSATGRAIQREPIEQAIARHESASVALSATLWAVRELDRHRTRSPELASPGTVQLQCNARAHRKEEPGRAAGLPHPDARAPRAAPHAAPTLVAMDKAGRPRKSWWLDGDKTHVAAFSPCRPRSIEGATHSNQASESRRSSDRLAGQGMRAGAGFTPVGRTTLLAAFVAILTATASGVFMAGARRPAGSPVGAQSQASSPPHREAVIPMQEANAVAGSDTSPDPEAGRPPTSAPDATRPSSDTSFVGSSKTQAIRDSSRDLRMRREQSPSSHSRPAGDGSVASNHVAAAVEAAQAKADAFLRSSTPLAPGQEPAGSSPSGSPPSASPS
jgi:hypothetical protein